MAGVPSIASMGPTCKRSKSTRKRVCPLLVPPSGPSPAFQAHKALFFGGGHAAGPGQIVERHHLGADETALDVGEIKQGLKSKGSTRLCITLTIVHY